jgi:hypothetical protein
MREIDSPTFRRPRFAWQTQVAVGLALATFPVSLMATAPFQAPPMQAAGPSTSSPQTPVPHRKRPSPAHPLVQEPDPPMPVAPPEPEKPKWPAFDPPAQASVQWDSQGLKIDATNSSLQQILKDVSTETGAKVEGLTADERVFGAYGPGQARDVLSQLLQGSGYNVIMIGEQGNGTPRQILLSTRQTGANPPTSARNNPTNNNEEDAEPDEQPPPQEPGSNRPNFPPGGPMRSPQQIMQEMQQRQQQLQQQQQQQQPPQN